MATHANKTSPQAPANTHSKKLVRKFLLDYQNHLTHELSTFDGNGQFIEDEWQRENLGYGKTRVITNGDYFEQGGVNFSEIHGDNPPPSLLGRIPELEGQDFWGAGVSLVLHPINPFCPTVHLNYRYFEAGPVWWFGGGCDLTPYYAFAEDCTHWHQTIKSTMDQHDKNYYPAFKYWCDEYFFNHHRNESRGIGGSFYDNLNGNPGLILHNDYARKSEDSSHPALKLTAEAKSWDQLFAFQQDNANSFLKAYLPIAEKRRAQAYSEQEREFQLYRRGRYVEFNLLHDRGTLFGIQSNGRTESILMSLPPLVRWKYNFTPEPGSREEALTQQFLKKHINWIK
jgi:coproporphyrinogen III oxidase